MKCFGMLSTVVIAMAVMAQGAWAQSGSEPVSGSEAKKAGVAVGEKMPDFKLKDVEGNTHTLEQYRGKIVVLEFRSHKCPFSRGADPDIAALAKEYRDKDIVLLGIDSNTTNTPEQIREYAQKVKIEHPILKDHGTQFADKVNAQKTPELYVVDKEGKLAYHGAFDNRRGPTSEATEHYTKDAIDALRAGEKVVKSKVPAWGCEINRAG